MKKKLIEVALPFEPMSLVDARRSLGHRNDFAGFLARAETPA